MCSVIEACGRNGVARIGLADGTVIEFAIGLPAQQEPDKSIDYSAKVVDNRNVQAISSPYDTLLDDSKQMEMELEDLALNNPVAYEQLIINRIAEGASND